MIEIVAHRGASFDAPENTLAAFRLAWHQHADAVECDVRLTRDGRLVVIHDPDSARVAGVDRPVADQTLAELRRLDVGRGERVPILGEVLATVPAGKRVYVEVKAGPEAVPELDRVLAASGLGPLQMVAISFSADVVAAAKAARPDRPAYLVAELTDRTTAAELIATATAIRADGLDLSANPAVLDAAFAAAVRAAGLKLCVWTVNDADLAREMVGVGVGAITTDRPGWLRGALGL
ncbi:MAG: glycerophosphodiester phosphodiesterase [Isosphaera sp.]|nr:glycerophosphodiester phosphodiesterase [Isosphaera sp.]